MTRFDSYIANPENVSLLIGLNWIDFDFVVGFMDDYGSFIGMVDL